MKKFVILFLLLVLSFSTQAQTSTLTAAELTPIAIEVPKIEISLPAPEIEIIPIEIPEPDITTVPLPSEADLRCMQENLFFEARNQGERGMKAVAAVTMNRTHDPRYPKTVCGVVQEKTRTKKGKVVCQFSWFCDWKLKNGPKLLLDAELEAWEMAGKVARMAFDGTIGNLVGNATHYHATYVRPKWARKIQRIVRIGTHIFYYERLPQ